MRHQDFKQRNVRRWELWETGVDESCRKWGEIRGQVLGWRLLDTQLAKHQLGAMKSLLGAIRQEGEGAGQGSSVHRHWPEVYVGDALDIHRAFQTLPEDDRSLLDLHYAFPPIGCKAKAHFLRLALRSYFDRLSKIRRELHGLVRAANDAHNKTVDALHF